MHKYGMLYLTKSRKKKRRTRREPHRAGIFLLPGRFRRNAAAPAALLSASFQRGLCGADAALPFGDGEGAREEAEVLDRYAAKAPCDDFSAERMRYRPLEDACRDGKAFP